MSAGPDVGGRVHLSYDEENGAEDWWHAARELAEQGSNPTFSRVLRAIDDEDRVTVTEADAKIFLEAASTLPDWHSDYESAPHPIIWNDVDDDEDDDDSDDGDLRRDDEFVKELKSLGYDADSDNGKFAVWATTMNEAYAIRTRIRQHINSKKYEGRLAWEIEVGTSVPEGQGLPLSVLIYSPWRS